MRVEISKHESFSALLDLEVDCITLDNGQMSVQILNYGCTMISINVPDRDGNVGNILLNYDDPKSMLVNPLYLNTVIGPSAGRIENAKLNLEGIVFELEKNNGDANLHGGNTGFHKQLWEIRERSVEMNYCGVSLFHSHKHMTGGFPGNMEIYAHFRLHEDNRLSVSFKATTDQPCHLNMAHHNYFNLTGDCGIKLDDHILFINAMAYRPLQENGIPVSDSESVVGTPFDFRVPKQLSEVFAKPFNGLDHPFDLNIKSDLDQPSVILEDGMSGRKLTINSNQSCVVVYTNNIGYKNHEGICFEMQHYPNVVQMLYPDEEYDHFTEYIFE
ncbi:MAG: aldose epimerase family protein [Bacillota bacterium]|nr:aldose epimerase family protein [Bacillota bacterium]